jgi:cytochrome c-type biogenesis protein CcmE
VRRTHQRLIVIGVAGALLVAATGLVLAGLSNQVNFFYGPHELAAQAKPGQKVRIGGLIEAGSIRREADGALAFKIRDEADAVNVRYMGVPPDLFGENQGVMVEGVYQGGPVFTADTILAKHDENYMPKEVADALKRSGRWKEGEAVGAPGPTPKSAPPAPAVGPNP